MPASSKQVGPHGSRRGGNRAERRYQAPEGPKVIAHGFRVCVKTQGRQRRGTACRARQTESSGAKRTLPFFSAALTLVLLFSCGSVGEPLPPLLNIPERSHDLSARQTEQGIILEWTWPETTTEGMPLTDLERFGIHFMAAAPGQPPPGDFEIQSKWLRDVEGAGLENLGPGDPVQATLDAEPFLGKVLALGVRAESRRGRSAGFSNLIVIEVLPPPAAPAAPQITVTSDAIELTWPAVPSARSYRLYRRDETGGEFKPVTTTTETAFRDSQFAWDETYLYRVQSLTGSPGYEVEGRTSKPAQVTTRDTFPPAAPTGLRVVPGLDSIELSWQPGPEPDLAGYRLRRVAGDAEAAVLEPSLIPTLNFNDKTVEKGVTYRYQLSAVDQNNNESSPTESREVRLP